jgi:hypothetical protein
MFLKQSLAYTFRFGPFLDDTDGKTAETGLTIEDSHIRVSKAGTNFIDKAETSNSAHDEAGYYVVVLNGTDTNTVGELQIACHMSGALPVFKTFQVVETDIYAAIFADSATLAASVASILGDTGELQTDWANGGRLDLLLDATLADTAELQGDWANGGRLDLLIDEILVDTGTTLDGKLDTIDNFLDTEIALILADTGELQTDWANGGRLDLLLDAVLGDTAELQGDWANGGRLDLIVDGILADTAVIGSAGAGLSAIPWNAAWDAEVQSECAEALVAYDPPTKAEMDAMWTTAMVESYAGDNVDATPAQILYMILCAVSEFSISGTTITGKEINGTSTAMTWTLDDASNPTSRTRAT